MKNIHKPVLLKEAIEYLNLQEGQVVVDGTFGLGGHGREIARRIGERGKLIGIEQDKRTLKIIESEISRLPQIEFVNGNFADIKKILHDREITNVDAVLLDLGVSSYQIDSQEHGLSWQTDAPLDMRLGIEGETALELIHRLTEEELANLLYQNADEYLSRRITRVIKQNQNNIKSTKDLANIIEKNIRRRGKIHPATKTFQALRLEVNHEIENLQKFLQDAPDIIKPSGRLVIISFHSGEDRIVKQEFKKDNWRPLTKKPIVPSHEEILENPRARSAKLRAAELR